MSSPDAADTLNSNGNPWLTSAAVAACVVGACATRLGFCAFPFHGDSGLYAVMGRTVATGGVLYRDFYENKPPGVGLLASLFWRCFGNWWPGYAIGELLLTLAAAGMLARAATRHAGRHATAATFAAAVVLLNFGWVVYTGFQLETIQSCLATMAAAVALEVIDPVGKKPEIPNPKGAKSQSNPKAQAPSCIRTPWPSGFRSLGFDWDLGLGGWEFAWDALLVGLLAGCAAMVKPTGIAVAIALAGTLILQTWHGRLARASARLHVRAASGPLSLWERVRVRVISSGATVSVAPTHPHPNPLPEAEGTIAALLALVGGFAIPAATVAAWVWRTNLAPEMPHLFHQIALYGSQTPADWYILIKLAIAAAFLAVPLIVRGWICRHHDAVPVRQRRAMPAAVWIFVIAWFTLETLGIVLQGRMYLYHFLPMAPPIALAYGLLPRSSRAPAVALGLLPAAILSVFWEGSDLASLARSAAPSPLSRYVLAHTTPTDSLFADNMGQLLMETGRPPGSRYGLFYYWVNYDTAPQDYCHGMLADFDTRRPAYIVLDHRVDDEMHGIFHGVILGVRPLRSANAQHAWADFRTYVAAHYRLETHVGDQDLFRRMPEPPTVQTANVN